ncbi:MAG: 50S ribosomal protein L11 methyltransferase [Eubacteriales bacterium]|nr:50S ribosomal protein L11 methyltransferase [Eubacteriales bacterium]
MKWIEFSVHTVEAGIEPVCNALSSVGLDQVSINESAEQISAFLAEHAKYWDYADANALAGGGPAVTAYIADVPENQPLLQSARAAIATLQKEQPALPLQCTEVSVDEEDWANSWKKYYKPIPIGKRMLVCPSWEQEAITAAEEAGGIVVRLDPGMVFGTGGHHTTRMCLEFLEKHIAAGMTVLDLGCGSGILSIAALLLGADKAVCVDIDPVALRVVGENLDMNGVAANRCQIVIGDVLTDGTIRREIAGQYSVVVANIVADVIIPLSPLAYQCCEPGGLYICSGITKERSAEVQAAVTNAGFVVQEVLTAQDAVPTAVDENKRESGGWTAILAVKPTE